MPRLTFRQQIIRGLERLGYTRDPAARATRFTVFTDHRTPGARLFVGRVDALRRGRTVANSTPDDRLKRAALNAGLSERM